MIVLLIGLFISVSASGCAQTSTNCFQAQGTTGQFVGGSLGGNNIILNLPAPASTVTYTFPDAGASADVLLSQGNLNIGGSVTQQYSGNVAMNIYNSGTSGSAALYFQGSTSYGKSIVYQAGDGKLWAVNQATGANSVIVFQVASTNVMQVASDGLHFFTSSSDAIITSSSQSSNRKFTLPTVASDSKFVVDHGNNSLINDSGFVYASFDSKNGHVTLGGAALTSNTLTVKGGAYFDGIKFPTSGGTPASLNFYEANYVFTTTLTALYCSGCTSTYHVSCTRIGNTVTLDFDSTSGTTDYSWNGHGALGTALPARFRSSRTRYLPYIATFNYPTNGAACIEITSAGNVYFWAQGCGQSFTPGNTVGWTYPSITYNV